MSSIRPRHQTRNHSHTAEYPRGLDRARGRRTAGRDHARTGFSRARRAYGAGVVSPRARAKSRRFECTGKRRRRADARARRARDGRRWAGSRRAARGVQIISSPAGEASIAEDREASFAARVDGAWHRQRLATGMSCASRRAGIRRCWRARRRCFSRRWVGTAIGDSAAASERNDGKNPHKTHRTKLIEALLTAKPDSLIDLFAATNNAAARSRGAGSLPRASATPKARTRRDVARDHQQPKDPSANRRWLRHAPRSTVVE